MLASIVSFIDRQVVAIVVEPMKADLAISDTQVGWLYGVFAVFYAVAALPIAYLADQKSRKHIIATGIFFWSVMTVLCGLSRNYWQIFLARIGVGVGEASFAPATVSMVGDLFARKDVPLALSVFQTAAVMGSGIAFIIGGYVLELVQGSDPMVIPLVGELAPWQQTFVYVGLPGIALALAFSPLIMRVLKSSLTEVMVEDYITLARLRGIGERRILLHHALKNGVLPTLTLVGVQFGFLFGGTLLVEIIFAYPGLGNLMVRAIRNTDLPVIQMAALTYCVVVLASNTVVDVLYVVLNPKLRKE